MNYTDLSFKNDMQALVEELQLLQEQAAKTQLKRIKTQLLINEQYDMLEFIEIKELKEGVISTVADIGITAGQMMGGTVSQVAGIAGLVKYIPEFQNNLNKDFLDWFGPFISVFFSIQALVFPAPAVGGIKVALQGLAGGAKALIKGGSGMLVKGIMAVLKKGFGFISKIIGLLTKGISGVVKAVNKGGKVVADISQKIGAPTLAGLMKNITKKGDEVVKRLDFLSDGLKTIKSSSKTFKDEIKDLLTKAFKGPIDDLKAPQKVIRGASKPVKGKVAKVKEFYKTDIAKMHKDFMNATKQGRESLLGFVRTWMSKNQAMMDDALKPLIGKEYGALGNFKGITRSPAKGGGGAFKFEKGGSIYIDRLLDRKNISTIIDHIAKLKNPALDIILIAFSKSSPKIAKNIAKSPNTARILAASQGDMEDFNIDSYFDSNTKEYERKQKVNEAVKNLLSNVIYDSYVDLKLIKA